ncbi:hypothetical protein PsorP6_011200 [Peronosclerospora sorghi]|uniref:Uncharacterized protein n=1 Tax=Peronosclerospora sorghi TaxID=230839 RepID=A0ACC0VWC4_9STRA|nr:hypothetical protein PsorP6_011200 [Peronosclerospora sorghi]
MKDTYWKKGEATDFISPLHAGHCNTWIALQAPQLAAASFAFENVHCMQDQPMIRTDGWRI